MSEEKVFEVTVPMKFYVLADDAELAGDVIDEVALIGTNYLQRWGAVTTVGPDREVREITMDELAPRTLEDLQRAGILRERIRKAFNEKDYETLGRVASPVADGVIELAKNGGWMGTSMALLHLLKNRGVECLPENSEALVNTLRRFIPHIEAAGVQVELRHEDATGMTIVEIRRED